MLLESCEPGVALRGRPETEQDVIDVLDWCAAANVAVIPFGGGSSVVDATGWTLGDGFETVTVPSMRMIVDLSDLDKSRWVNQTGISGHPADSHYADQLESWLDGKDFAWPFSVNAVREAKDEEQTFKPEP